MFGKRFDAEVDTGAPGLVIPMTYLSDIDLGPPTGVQGSIKYGIPAQQINYYNVYYMPVVYDNGVVTASIPVGVIYKVEYRDSPNNPYEVIDPSEWPEYSVDSDMGVGVGKDTGGLASPVLALPRDLRQGLLIDMSPSEMSITFGTNPLPKVTSIPGWYYTTLGYEVSYQDKSSGFQVVDGTAIIDSGGLGGEVQRADLPPTIGAQRQTLPVGTVISVYTQDKTLLYTTKVTEEEPGVQATYIADFSYLNTGIAPFRQGPIYFEYTPPGQENPYGGTVIFDYAPK